MERQARRLPVELQSEVSEPAIPLDLEHYGIAGFDVIERRSKCVEERHGESIHGVDNIPGMEIDQRRLAAGRFGRDDESVFAPQTWDGCRKILVDLDAKNSQTRDQVLLGMSETRQKVGLILTCPDSGSKFQFTLLAEDDHPKLVAGPAAENVVFKLVRRQHGFSIQAEDDVAAL